MAFEFDQSTAKIADESDEQKINKPAAATSFEFDAGTAKVEEAPGVAGTLWQGAKSAGRAIGATVDTYTGNGEAVVEKAQAQQQAPKAPELQDFYAGVQRNKEDDPEDAGLWEGVKNVGGAVLDNPKGAGLAVVEQLPNAVPTLAGGWAGMKGGAAAGGAIGSVVPGVGTAAGAAVGGVLGGLAGMFLGNTAIETGHKAMSAADDGEYTPEEQGQVKKEGAIKGAVITGIDALTLGLGGKVATAMHRTGTAAVEAATRKVLVDNGIDVTNEAAVLAAKSSPEISAAVRAAQESAVKVTDTFKRRALEAGTLLSMESIGEGAGEYLGELAATGKADVTDAVMEAAMSLGQSGVEASWNMARSRGDQGLWKPAEQVQPMPTADNPAPAPVDRPDPSAGPLSAAANLLPAPEAGSTLYGDEAGNVSGNRPSWVNPNNDPNQQSYGPGMDSQATGMDQQTPVGKRFTNQLAAKNAISKAPEPSALEVIEVGPKQFEVQAKAPVLQNRDRSTPASITQMRSIAANPDYSRLGFSRDFANGAPVVEPGANVLPQALGRQDVATTGSGRKIPVQYAVVEAASLMPSHDVNGSPDEQYAAGAKGKSRAIAGNGRVAGLRHAFTQGTAGQYVEQMTGDASLHGISPAVIRGMKEPVLVRIMPREEITQDIGDESNTTGVSALSGAEQAMNDARRISIDDMEFSESGEISETTVRQFVQSMPAAERNNLLDGSRPSRQAYDRAESAIFANAYESEALIRLQAQATDPEVRTVLSGLLVAAPKMARLKGAGAWDIRGLVVEAAEAAVNARRNGQTLEQYAQQIDLDRNPESQYFVELFAANIRSAKRIGEELSNIAELFYAESSKPEFDMLGAVPRRSRQELLNGATDADTASQSASAQAAGNQAGPGTAAPGGQGAGAQPAEPAGAGADARPESFQLDSYSEEELAAQAAAQAEAAAQAAAADKAAADKAQADRDRNDFTLSGSDRPADIAASRGQNDMFAPPTRGEKKAEQEKAANNAPEADRPASTSERQPIRFVSGQPASDYLTDGATIEDGQGQQYRVHYQRNDLVVAHPIIDGKAQVNAGSTVRFHVGSPDSADGRRTDPIYLVEGGSQQAPASVEQQLASMDEAALSALIDEISEQEAAPQTSKPKAKRSAKGTTASGKPRVRATTSKAERTDTSKPADVKRSAGEIAKSLGVNMSSAGMNALEGLTQLFGGPGRLSSGLSFDEDTYAKAKPLFAAAMRDIEAAGKDLRDFIRALLSQFGDGVKPYILRYAQDIKQEQNDVYTDQRVEPDRAEDAGQAASGDVGGANAGSVGRGNGSLGQGEGGQQRPDAAAGVSGRGAAAQGERGDQSLDGAQPAVEGGAAGTADGSGGRPSSTGGLFAGRDADAAADRAVAGAVTPAKANVQPSSKPGTAAEIKAQMPFLTDGQAEDVAFAERRLSKPDGYGVLYTNGTGTGKTFSGLGIAARAYANGKTNILIVVPKQTIADAWVKAGEKFFGLPIKVLGSTKDNGGSGIVVTTYANLGANPSLALREWDMVIADEAHYLSSAEDGATTSALENLRALTKRRGYARDLVRLRESEKVERLRSLTNSIDQRDKEIRDSGGNAAVDQRELARDIAERDELNDELNALYEAEEAAFKAMKPEDAPRGVLLSATPFAYEKNVHLAQQFLFDWGSNDESGQAYNSGGPFERFMMQHFGYRMRYNKLTEPDAKVDRGLMQRAFNSWLKREGALSARALESEFDYDRKFVTLEAPIGRRVDDALKWLRNRASNRDEQGNDLGMSAAVQTAYRDLQEKIVGENFNYHARMYFLEAIKAREALPHIRAHLAKGRKVVVMHDFKQGGAGNPFIVGRTPDNQALNDAIAAFSAEFSDLQRAFSYLPSPIAQLTKAFPDALVYNGDYSAKKRVAMQNAFNDDSEGAPNLIIAQGDAMREGVSIHDTTGKHQRVLVHLGMPVKPTAAIQQEGRIYRTGQASHAMFRYFTIGTAWERSAFAGKIAKRAGAAENLAMGEQARGLKQAFIDAYENADLYEPGFAGEGQGGKESDQAAAAALTPWDSAKSFYFGTKVQGKGRSSRGREGKDYFATPEPVGLKMVEWADIRTGEDVLEPSAGHGAIARWFPDGAKVRVIEQSAELASRVALHVDGDVVHGNFEDHHIVNKYDAIVMNPPYGLGGAEAIPHLAKASNHLRDGGRVVALIPTGPAADKKFDNWFYALDKDGKSLTPGLHLIADVKMPGVTFERAGTGVATRLVIIEKVRGELVEQLRGARQVDLSSIDSIGELFDRLEHMEMPARLKPVEEEAEQTAPAKSVKPAKQSYAEQAAAQVEKLVTDAPIVEHTTAKGKVLKGVIVTDMSLDDVRDKLDKYAFRKDGGVFVRQEYIARPDAGAAANYSLSPATREAYEARIDELFAGAAPSNTAGVRVVDRSDVLDLLGYGASEVVLAEKHAVSDGRFNHPQFTAADWKKVPDWLENPVAVFERDDGHLTVIAPETKNGQPIIIGVSPDARQAGYAGGKRLHVLLSAYNKDNGRMPIERMVREGQLRFIDQRKSPAFSDSSGHRLPSNVADLRGLGKKVYTGADLFKYRSASDQSRTLLNTGPAKGIPLFSAQGIAKKLRASLGLQVEAVATEADLPAEVLAQIQRDGVSGRVAGLYDPATGISYIVASNLHDTKHAIATVLHEAIGHAGVKAVLGDRIETVMRGIYRDMPRALRDELERRYAGQLASLASEAERQALVAEEYVAHLAEHDPQNRLLDRIVALVKQFIRKVFGADAAGKWTRADVVQLLAEAKRAAGRGPNGGGTRYRDGAALDQAGLPEVGEVSEAEFVASLQAAGAERAFASAIYKARGTASPFFQRWFGNSRMVDKQGRPVLFTHRSYGERDSFKDEDLGGNTGTATAHLGHFLARKDVGNVERYGPNVEQFYVKMEKPKVITQDQFEAMGDWSVNQVKAYRKSLMEQGHDGLYIQGLAWPVVFEGKNIKARRNVGTFDESANVRYSAQLQTETPAFKRWFGDSKVVDADGKPLVVQHGTDAEFTVFNQSRMGTFGTGIYFADSESNGAEAYGDNVVSAYLSLQNPWVIDVDPESDGAFAEDFDHPGVEAILDLPNGRKILDKGKETGLFGSQLREELEGLGYDGVIATYPDGSKEYVAFRPEQIKSAIGNNGDFDPANADIRYSLNSTAAEREALRKLGLGGNQGGLSKLAEAISNLTTGDLKTKIKSMATRAEEGLFDGLVGIKRAEEAVGVNDPNRQGYVSARLATGLADVMHGVLYYGAPEWRDGMVQRREGTRGVLEILGDLGQDNLQAWLGWLGGKRAQLLKNEGRENNLSDADIAELLAMADGKEALFERIYQEYAAINDAVLDMAEQAGLVDPAAREQWATAYYVPFYRQLESEGIFTGPRTKRGLSHQTAAIKKLKGGKLPTNDLLVNILSGWTKRIDASMKNKALLETVDNLAGSDYLTDEGMRWTRLVVPRSEVVKKIKGDRNYLEFWAEQLGLDETANHLQVAHELNKLDARGYEELWGKVAPTDPDIIRVQRGGKNEFYRVNDESLLRGLKFIEGSTFNDPITRIGRTFKRILTTGVTASPDFILRNFIRDAAHAWTINKDGFTLGVDSIKGMRDAFREDSDYRDLMFAGASFQGGYIHGTDPEASADIIRRALAKKGLNRQQQDGYLGSLVNSPAKAGAMLRTGWEKYREFGDKVENANRLSTYKAALAAGKSKRQAAFEAKDLMDFSLRGNFAAAQWFTDVVPFLNARAQGLYKLGRAMKGDRTLIAKEVAIKGGYLALFTLLLAAANGDDERYKALPDWDKDANWHLWFSEDQEQPFRIPKPFELGLLFGTLPERLLHAMTGNQDSGDLAKAVVHGVFQTLAFNPVPQFYQPIRELQANRNFFFDTPIEDMSDEGKLPEARYDERTSALSRSLGELTGPTIGVSPKQLDHLVRGYTGTLGGYVLSVSNLIAGIGSDAERPAATAGDIPVVKVVYSGESVKSTQYQTEFYDMMQEAEQLHRTIRSYTEEGKMEEARELLEENRDKLRHRPALGFARKQLGNVRKQMDAVYRDTSMDAAAKREKLNALQERANAIAKRVTELAGEDF
ncbi:LPD38 domain-containing protein [Aquipseudomonas alcaligenes]|uniref:LPD38 domain-containing protein n=1 Tax=Aquipseudomonas alcaligenes TaxID=43263 RepID=UPI003654798A